jgi:hypothetical protein
MTSNLSNTIAELTAQHALLATAMVLGFGDTSEHVEAWSQTMRAFSPAEFLVLWNEVQADTARKLGPHMLVTRVQLFEDRRVRTEYVNLMKESGTYVEDSVEAK